LSDSVCLPATPSDADTALALGYDRLYTGQRSEAARAFHRAAVYAPGLAEAWAAAGEALALISRAADAAAGFDRAVRLDGGVWGWRLGLAEALLDAGLPGALETFAALVEERGDSAPALRGHARALDHDGQTGAALDRAREAAVLAPRNAETALALADLLIRTGDGLAAVESLQPWLHGGAADDDTRFRVAAARAWTALGEPAKARALLDSVLARDPEDPDARDLLARLADDPGAAMTPAYVRALFDRYAERFDRDLVGKLGYVAPALLRDGVDRARGHAGGGLRVIDLGCGSGLAGVTFRPLADHLAGVDLSSRMVDKARERGLYDALQVGDAAAALEPGAGWDLAVAADVLVYIGALEPLFAALAASLVPGGLFAATTERLSGDAGEPFRLGPSRRYAHAPDYVTGTARAAGFEPCLIEACSPRREGGAPVAGTLHVYRKR
jgi:predicted TPR repeat methyltransferase